MVAQRVPRHRVDQYRPTQVLAAREAPDRKLRECIKHAAIAADGLRKRFTRERRKHYSLSRESTGVELSGFVLPYERQARRCDCECPAPRVLDPGIRELWKNTQQMFAYHAGNIVGIVIRVGFATAKQEPMVAGDAEVVNDEAAIGNGKMSAYQAFSPFCAQGLCGFVVVVDGHHPGFDCRLQVAQVTVAGQNEISGLDRRTVRVDLPACGVSRDAGRRTVLV